MRVPVRDITDADTNPCLDEQDLVDVGHQLETLPSFSGKLSRQAPGTCKSDMDLVHIDSCRHFEKLRTRRRGVRRPF